VRDVRCAEGGEVNEDSIEKAAEAIKVRAIHTWLMALPDKMCEEMARAALPHLLEDTLREPTLEEISEATKAYANDGAQFDYSTSGTIAWTMRWVARRRNAAGSLGVPGDQPKIVELTANGEVGKQENRHVSR